MANKKKQHFVPQCYLRGFANEQSQLFSLNKVYFSKPANSYSTSSVAWREYFHDVDASMFEKPEMGPQQVEDELSKVEGIFRETLNVFLAEADAGSVSVETSMRFAPFVAIQWLRTESVRKALAETDIAFKQAVVDALSGIEHGVPAQRLVPPTDHEKLLHLSYLTDNSAIQRLSSRFANMVWIIGRNSTSQPVYTSDSPIVRHRNPPKDDPDRVNSDVGLVFVFPLNSHFLLFMAERYMATQVSKVKISELDRQTIEFSDTDLRFCNKLQVAQSRQYVYCLNDDFNFAREVCWDEPRICDPDRERIRITSVEFEGNNIRVSAKFVE